MAKDSDSALILKEIQSLRLDNKAEFDKLNASNETFSKKIDKICRKINDHEERLSLAENKIVQLTESQAIFEERVGHNVSEAELVNKQITQLKAQVESLEIDKRKNNITITGVPVKAEESSASLAAEVQSIFRERLGVTVDIPPSQIFRRGARKRIILKLSDSSSKAEIFKNTYKLKGSNVFVSNDYTINQEFKRYQLRVFIKEGGGKFNSQFSVLKDGVTYFYDSTLGAVVPKKQLV